VLITFLLDLTVRILILCVLCCAIHELLSIVVVSFVSTVLKESTILGSLLRVTGGPRNFVWGGGVVQQIQLRTERMGSGGGSPLVRGSGGSCNLVQEISFHTVKCS